MVFSCRKDIHMYIFWLQKKETCWAQLKNLSCTLMKIDLRGHVQGSLCGHV